MQEIKDEEMSLNEEEEKMMLIQRKEIRNQKLRIRLEFQKLHGIVPEDFQASDVDIAYAQKVDDIEIDEDEGP